MPPKRKQLGTKRQEQAHKAEKLSKMKNCHFSKQEVERLLQLFKEFTKLGPNEVKRSKNGIDRGRFRDILYQHFAMTEDILMDKVYKAFDLDNDGFISEEEWVIGLSIFLRGTLEEQARFCFGVYSNMRTEEGYISRDEMYILLKHTVVKQQSDEDPEEMPKDLVELCLKKMDLDHDGRLSVDDYITSVQNEGLLVEAFGPCLPSDKCKQCFLELISDEKAGRMY